MRTRVKICGITSVEDAHAAVAAGADALGFVFAESPRRVTPEQAARIAREVPPFIATVGVFVDSPPGEVAAVASQVRLTALQLHGNEPPESLSALHAACPGHILKAFRVRNAGSLALLAAYVGQCDAIVLDAFVPGTAGGTGHVFDWSLAEAARSCGAPLVLAGGLTPANVGEAIRRVRPYAVDVSSGVEAQPGRKDPERMQAFMAAVAAADEEK